MIFKAIGNIGLGGTWMSNPNPMPVIQRLLPDIAQLLYGLIQPGSTLEKLNCLRMRNFRGPVRPYI